MHDFRLKVHGTVPALAIAALLLSACGAKPPSTATTTTTSKLVTTTTFASTTTSAPVMFHWTVTPIDPATRSLMIGRTWRPACPVTLDQLRLVTLNYLGFDGSEHHGQLVINADSTTAVVGAFRYMFTHRFPIRTMQLVDYFGGSDVRSMSADNTSAFNCRIVPGTTVWSQHAYGRAVDVNPFENPEVQDSFVDPPNATLYANRSLQRIGMIHYGDAAWTAFHRQAWFWGGQWTSLKDYQHFSMNGQ